MRLTRLIFLITIVFSSEVQGQQSWDYDTYPVQNVDFTKAEIELTVSPEQSKAGGVVTYTAKALRNKISRITLHGAELSIDAVTINERPAGFEISGDSIHVQLTDTLQKEDGIKIGITWQSTSGFGFHSDTTSYIWSSMLPKALRHWLPVFDHPRNEMAVSLSVTVPEPFTVVAPGELISDEVVVGEGLRTFTWQSDTPIPATSIVWAAGEFNIIERNMRGKKVRLFVSEHTESDTLVILEKVSRWINAAESNIKNTYPYDNLNIVLLESSFGEIRNYGATVVFGFDQEAGGVDAQLLRGITAQWFGIRIRQERFRDQENVSSLFQAFTAGELVEAKFKPLYENRFLKNFELNTRFNEWVQADISGEDSLFYSEIKQLLPEFYLEFEGVTGWRQFSDMIYSSTGLPYPEIPAPVVPGTSTDTVEQHSQIVYDLTYQPNEVEGRLKLIFQAAGQADLELESGMLNMIGFSDTTSKEITFTGQSDTVSVEMNPATEWAYFSLPDSHIVVNEYKPIIYWLGQIRSEDPFLRKKAAAGLRNHTDNPDLQLALFDALSAETDPEVKASILNTLSQVTDGATGTEQRYLSEIKSNSKPVKLQAIRALGGYEGNSQVIASLRNQLFQTELDTVFKETVSSFIRVADSSQVDQVFDRLTMTDMKEWKVLHFASEAIPFLENQNIVSKLDEFLNKQQLPSLISENLELLKRLDEDATAWEKRISTLLKSQDPRLRYLALKHIHLLDQQRRVEIAEQIRLNEPTIVDNLCGKVVGK